MGEILVGMPGPWAEHYREKADHYTTKIGGLPDWPISEVDIGSELLRCRLCGGRLVLVAQVYAPISSFELNIEERVIYVLGCPIQDCVDDPQSWRALRLQKCHGETESALNSQNLAHSREASLPAPGVGKDFLLVNEAGLNDSSDSDMDMEDLARAVSEASTLASCSVKQNRGKRTNASVRASAVKPRGEDDSVPVLPCFYVYSQKVQSPGDMDAYCSGFPSLSLKEDHCTDLDIEDKEKWEGETYEYDRALGVDRSYLKFKKQMDAYPEQCIRYSYGGSPLLAATNLTKLDECKNCGSSRVYEMQLMSPLLYFLQQADDGSIACSADGWSWLTLIVYTCSRSCCSSKGALASCSWEVSEEAIIIQYD